MDGRDKHGHDEVAVQFHRCHPISRGAKRHPHAHPPHRLLRLARPDACSSARDATAMRSSASTLFPRQRRRIVGSIADRDLVRRTMREFEVEAVIHSGALHKPHVETHERSAFVAVNVQGTLNLLEEAVAPGSKVDALRHDLDDLADDFEGNPRRPRRRREKGDLDRRGNGAAAAAQHLWRHQIVGRTSLPPVPRTRTACRRSSCAPRGSFPKKTIWRMRCASRRTIPRPMNCCFAAPRWRTWPRPMSSRSPRRRRSASTRSSSARQTPFSRDDCEELIADAPAVVGRLFPHYRHIYARLGWTMFDSIDRIYDSGKAARLSGFTCRTGFAEKLNELRRAPPTG